MKSLLAYGGAHRPLTDKASRQGTLAVSIKPLTPKCCSRVMLSLPARAKI
jgi:hypothetical protein